MRSRIYLIPALLFFMATYGCKKEKVCEKLPEGLYEGRFTDNDSNAQYIPLKVKQIDQNSYVINSTGYTEEGPFMDRNDCYLGGHIEYRKCLGKIIFENNQICLKGNYTWVHFNNNTGKSEGIAGTFQLTPIQ